MLPPAAAAVVVAAAGDDDAVRLGPLCSSTRMMLSLVFGGVSFDIVCFLSKLMIDDGRRGTKESVKLIETAFKAGVLLDYFWDFDRYIRTVDGMRWFRVRERVSFADAE